MNRKTFINNITGGLTLTCISCMMQACSKEDATTPSNNNTGNTNNNNPNNNNSGSGSNAILTVNLSSQLLNINDFVLDKGVVVVRTA
jgi:hypothetical protein